MTTTHPPRDMCGNYSNRSAVSSALVRCAQEQSATNGSSASTSLGPGQHELVWTGPMKALVAAPPRGFRFKHGTQVAIVRLVEAECYAMPGR